MADLIDRAALLKALDYARTHNIGVRDAVKSVPIIDAEPVVHARWSMRPYSPDGDPAWGGELVCSNCGEGAPINYAEKQYESAYCIDCGARMDADAPERAGKDGRDG